jgi:hypothetical protein
MAGASVVFFGVVDGVFRDFNHHIALRQYGLAAQARVGLQAPGAVQQVVFGLICGIQAGQALAHDDVAGGAGAAHVAGVLDGDVVFQQGLAQRCAGAGANFGTGGAVFGVGQYFDNGHFVFL